MDLQARAHDEGEIRRLDEVPPVVEQAWQRLVEEDNVGLDEAAALVAADAAGHFGAGDVLAHQVMREGRLALDAALVGEAAVGFDDQLARDAGCALKAVNILGVELMQDALLGEQADENVRDSGLEVARVEVLGQYIEGLGVLPEEPEVEDGLGLREVELGKVRVQARPRRAEVGDLCGIALAIDYWHREQKQERVRMHTSCGG